MFDFEGKNPSEKRPLMARRWKAAFSFLTHSAVVRKHVKKTLPSGIGF